MANFWQGIEEMVDLYRRMETLNNQWNDMVPTNSGRLNIAKIEDNGNVTVGYSENVVYFQMIVADESELYRAIQEVNTKMETLRELIREWRELVGVFDKKAILIQSALPYGITVQIGDYMVSKNKSGSLVVETRDF